LQSELSLPNGTVRRCITRLAQQDGWQVEDQFEPKPGFANEFDVRWQFAPGAQVQHLADRRFAINLKEVSVIIDVSSDWAKVDLVENPSGTKNPTHPRQFEGIVSPAFRQTLRAPCLKLAAFAGEKPCVFRTTFLASPTS
jgi:hypothetical protein